MGETTQQKVGRWLVDGGLAFAMTSCIIHAIARAHGLVP
jgi:hypothetical protein